MALRRQADEQASEGFVIEKVTDFDRDWPQLEALVLGTVEYHRPWDSRTLLSDWASIMREYMETRCTTLLARRPGGQAVGFLSGTIRSDYGIFEGTFGHVDNVFVAETARGEGIGRYLYESFEAICIDRGVCEVSLDVAIGNDLGDRFWRRDGFETHMNELRKSLEARS